MKKWTETDRKLQEIRSRKSSVKSKGKDPDRPPTVQLNDLKFLSSIYRHKKRKIVSNSQDAVFKVPANFSIIDNPEETLLFISSVTALTAEIGIQKLKFMSLDHSGVEFHDLGAEILLGVAAWEVKRMAKFRNVDIVVRGNYPHDIRKARLIRKMGVVKKLNIENEASLKELEQIRIFDETGHKEIGLTVGSIDSKNRTVKKMVDYINSCLSATNRKLTESARGDVVDFLGEIIGNAEDHSGAKNWHVCGYLDDGTDLMPSEIRFCEIVIYNFGKSFSDTFLELDRHSYAMSLVSPYIDHHSKERFFGKTWSKSDLLTVAALQSHISCKNIDESTNRGQGTVDLIEFFQNVAKECVSAKSKEAKMALISGKTHILFDETYKIQEDSDGREIIAFNSNNDLNEKPDSNYVKHLSGPKFPGTLIAIRFPLKYKDTQEVVIEDKSL